MSLHAMWDWGILEPAVQGDERGYAMRLNHEITAEEAADWQRDWANESYRIARDRIYGEMRPSTVSLEFADGSAFLPIVNQQLEKAGVRLAAALNQALR
jgi:S1/P1 Nuclease